MDLDPTWLAARRETDDKRFFKAMRTARNIRRLKRGRILASWGVSRSVFRLDNARRA